MASFSKIINNLTTSPWAFPSIIEDSLWLPFEEYEKEDAEKAL